MKKWILFCLLILPLVWTQEYRTIFITRIQAAEKKANGNAWDARSGKPDLRIRFYLENGEEWNHLFTSKVHHDTFVVEKPINTKALVTWQARIRVEIIDSDIARNDDMGTGYINISEESFSPMTEHKVTFGQIQEFSYILSPHDDIKTYQQEVFKQLKELAAENARKEAELKQKEQALQKKLQTLEEQVYRLELKVKEKDIMIQKWKSKAAELEYKRSLSDK